MATTMNPDYEFEPDEIEDRTRWGVVPYSRQIIGLGLFVMAIALILAVMAHIGHVLGTVDDASVSGNFSQFMASAPLILFATVLVVTLMPPTFGLTMIAAMAIIGVCIPFFRDRQQARERREQSVQHGFSEPHEHIPQTGFELGVH